MGELSVSLKQQLSRRGVCGHAGISNMYPLVGRILERAGFAHHLGYLIDGFTIELRVDGPELHMHVDKSTGDPLILRAFDWTKA